MWHQQQKIVTKVALSNWNVLLMVSMCAGVYGDVQRVKIMFNKKDNALVAFADPMQAQIGKNIIQLQTLSPDYKKIIRIRLCVWRKAKATYIASRWVHRESNFIFKFCSDKD